MNCGKERDRGRTNYLQWFPPWLPMKFTWDFLKSCSVQVPDQLNQNLRGGDGKDWTFIFYIFQVIQMVSHGDEPLSYCQFPSPPPDKIRGTCVPIYAIPKFPLPPWNGVSVDTPHSYVETYPPMWWHLEAGPVGGDASLAWRPHESDEWPYEKRSESYLALCGPCEEDTRRRQWSATERGVHQTRPHGHLVFDFQPSELRGIYFRCLYLMQSMVRVFCYSSWNRLIQNPTPVFVEEMFKPGIQEATGDYRCEEMWVQRKLTGEEFWGWHAALLVRQSLRGPTKRGWLMATDSPSWGQARAKPRHSSPSERKEGLCGQKMPLKIQNLSLKPMLSSSQFPPPRLPYHLCFNFLSLR